MADQTKIEWTDATWNPITGCSIVSPGCTNCYAMALAGTRLKKHESRKGLTKQVNGKHVWTGEVRFNDGWLDQPLRWTKPRQIFVCAHGDLFAEGVPDEWIDQIFAVMALCPQHTFQVLTKRPERMRDYLKKWSAALSDGSDAFFDEASSIAFHFDVEIRRMQDRWPLPNVWLGVSVEDQRRADERIPILLDTPAAIRWISAEPLLGPVMLTKIFDYSNEHSTDALAGRRYFNPRDDEGSPVNRIDWVVAGGESGHDARPMHTDWARALRDQCAAAGVPFLFKQWGEFGPAFGPDLRPTGLPWSGEAQRAVAHGTATVEQATRRVGKRRAGRLLDGVEHNAFPTTPQREEAR